MMAKTANYKSYVLADVQHLLRARNRKSALKIEGHRDFIIGFFPWFHLPAVW